MVLLNGRLAGQLRRATSGAIDFQYAHGWLGWEHTLPVSLSLPLREDRYVGAAVVAVFDNLLPDSDEIRGRLAARTRADGTDVFSLLYAVGRDCVGALQFIPEGEAHPATLRSDRRFSRNGRLRRRRVLDEIARSLPGAIDEITHGLPDDFSRRLNERLAGGSLRRLRTIGAQPD